MSKVLIDRELLERVQERLDPHRDAVLWGDVCDTFRSAPSGTPAMPVKAYYHEWTDLEGVRTRSVGLEVRKEFADAPLVLESDAQARIACLEGEIAKRDETIARLEPQLNRAIQANYDLREELAACRVAVENCELFRARIVELEDDLKCAHSMLAEVSKAGMALRAELSAIKAQEPVAEVKHGPLDSSGWPEFVRVKTIGDFDLENLPNGMKLYAAPVSEAKAQGVVMPEPSGWVGGGLFFHDRDKALEAAAKSPCVEVYSRSQMLARLAAAPVQQVSVPDGFERYRLADKFCEQRLVTDNHVRAIVVDAFASGYGFGIAAAHPAAQAADAGLSLIEWTKDAVEWGGALNYAAWEFVNECPEKSALLFNNTKGPLRAAIMKYAEIVAANAKDSSHD